MKNLVNFFAVNDRKSLSLLAEQSSHALEAIKELKALISAYHDMDRNERKAKAGLVKGIERKADNIKHAVEASNRENIRKMSASLEEITNLINSIASRLIILSIERIDDCIARFIDLDIKLILEVNKLIFNLNKPKEIEEIHAKISILENKADNLYENALSELYHFYKNSIDIMKYREIYDMFEQIADKCKSIANMSKAQSSK